jgi:hypothetical protein
MSTQRTGATRLTSPQRGTLRDLAGQVAEIAALPDQQETVRLWKRLNGLRPERPMVMIDQIPWHEMDVDGELRCVCEDPFYRALETGLRRTLYRWRHMRADMVVEPYIDVPRTIRGAHLGITAEEDRSALDPENDVVGHLYHDQLQDDADLEKIRMPEISLDAGATDRDAERAREIFDDIIEVRMQGVYPSFAFWDRIAEWHGVERSLYDLVDRPEFLHRMIARITAAYHRMLDQLEEQGLLGSPMATIHCTGAWADELPAPGFEPERVRARDLWTYGMAQVFSSVSPAMHEEFEIEYARPWYERFGLGYYGCCEPLDRKVDIVRTIPNVRKISMSPWTDVRRGAEAIAGDFVFSRKPSPAFLSTDTMDEDAVRADLASTLDACRATGSPVELILKDISTVRYEPQRLWRWARIARELVEN